MNYKIFKTIKKMFYDNEANDNFEENEDFFEQIEEDDDLVETSNEEKSYENTEKTTLPVLTKYEKAVIIYKRAKQLDNNFKTTIPDVVKEFGLTKSIDIALKEYELKNLPSFVIKRKLNNKNYELWKLDEFKYLP